MPGYRGPGAAWVLVSLFMILLLFECRANSAFVAQGKALGLVDGLVTAFGISLLNIGASSGRSPCSSGTLVAA